MLILLLACTDPSIEVLQNDVRVLQQKVLMLEQRLQSVDGVSAAPAGSTDPLVTAEMGDPSQQLTGSPEQPTGAPAQVDGAPDQPKGTGEIALRMEAATIENRELSSEAQIGLMKTESPDAFCKTVAYKEGEKVIGYRISEIETSSAAAAMGLKEGDILVAISTRPIRDDAEWNDALLHLKKVQFSILLQRDGADILYNYGFGQQMTTEQK